MKSYSLFLCCLLIFGLFFSCKTSQNVIGTYISPSNHKKNGISRIHKFVINTDFTFHYDYIVMGHSEKHSSGTWKSEDGNIIVLNSDIRSSVIPLNVEITSSDNNCNPKVDLKLIIPGEDEKTYRCTPYFELTDNNYVKNFLPDRGSYSYEESNYYSNNHELFFKISKEPYWIIPGRGKTEYYLLETEHKKLVLNNGDIVKITISVPDSLFSYRIFNNTKLKLSGDKLIFKDFEKNNRTNILYFKK